MDTNELRAIERQYIGADYSWPELEHDIKRLVKEIEGLNISLEERNAAIMAYQQPEVERLRAALVKYANTDNWTNDVLSYGGPKTQLRWFDTLDEFAWSIARAALDPEA